MRRAERQVTDPASIDQIIQSCGCCRLGFADQGAAYIVPLNFGYRRENGVPVFYFHCTGEGRKLSLARKNRRAGFELDTGHELAAGETACAWTFHYKSVTGWGEISVLEEPAAKKDALGLIMAHYSGSAAWEFEPGALRAVTVMRLEVREMGCKVNL